MSNLAATETLTRDKNLAGALVLVVDDSVVARAVLEQELTQQGATVISAEDGEQALALLARRRPDVVLLDVEMPQLDGFAVLQVIRSHPQWCDLPVVFLTGRSRTTDLVDGLRRGATDYLRKPFDKAELVARVMTARRTGALQAELRRHNDELERLSLTDPLTGLPNRRHLHALLDDLTTNGGGVGVAIVDIDHFKRVNDQYGHAVGDSVITEVATRLREAAAPDGVVGRWGGEEFLLVVAATSIGDTLDIARRCHRAVRRSPITVETAVALVVTVSIGTAVGSDADAEHIVVLADEALYQAKAAGRDQVIDSRSRGRLS